MSSSTQSSNASLSQRGQRLVADPPTAPYIKRHFELTENNWNADTNPDGYVALCIAENRLVWDLLEPKMAQCREIAESTLGYDSMLGNETFRATVAETFSRTFMGRPVDPCNLAVVNGAGSVLELLFYVLCNPGDGVLVPTPSYTGFWADLETRDQLQIVTVDRSVESGFALTTTELDAAIEAADVPITALLYTNPDNPLGRVATPEELLEVIEWAESNNIHIVVDEIYALSVFGDAKFVSAARLRADLGDHVHIAWAFSKDFAMSGLRAGVLFSENPAVIEAINGLAYWAAVSGDTQSLLQQMLSDADWVDHYIAENQRRLKAAYQAVTRELDRHGVPYFPADAGFFLVVDLRAILDEQSWAAEDRLWQQMVDELSINITPGSACHNGEPGLVRLVFTSVPTEAAVVGAKRLGTFYAARRSEATGLCGA